MNIFDMRTMAPLLFVYDKQIQIVLFQAVHTYTINKTSMNEINVSINCNGLLSKKNTFKILNNGYETSKDFNKHVHNIDIFINDKWRKYAGGDIWRLLKITWQLELLF
jgi:hypothetical protein